MKKLLLLATMGVFTLSTISCRHSKESEMNVIKDDAPSVNNDDISKNVFTDENGEQMEVVVNNTKNIVTIRLEGKTYELKKNNQLPEFTATNAEYQYSNIRGKVTLLKKDYNMVLFQTKKVSKSIGNNMASY
ncbi:hypothetical protein [Chryseobacterium oryctis]|uniref:Lipoprotein n=1 Tax=Chryseobacterium oryctis TaxID=2952618 RepID=A0ABT3HRZ2_9FLAO|nr:hypothetical protein [Chryseobacterium oryctis]MCW3162388.1 hypothetical protein [Chryseobacterium oryctis]